ncbi:aspartic peptidase domain-containing protein [Cokeromyces recurvatus]|uniref:aspartic peptidase domain-containing protein n=1 Tax=Cokeromyces recurvatus TaxID=90255 RepID=UPI00221FFA94|nr:aspartic peptidase domain-containing protein [Cokeromyces recurvatus]KAI7907592.1 aspartic peptidase domain-containing protein [Cokeromyces recurvatus]
MVEKGLIDKAIFGIYIEDINGEIHFGDTDSDYYTEPILYAPVLSDTYWLTEMNQASFGNHSIGPRKIIIDSGTSLLITTIKDAQQIHSKIKGSKRNEDGTYQIPCVLKNKLPDLVLTINDHIILTLSSKDYVLVPLSNNKTMCISGIQGKDTHKLDHWVLGNVFMKAYYTVIIKSF